MNLNNYKKQTKNKLDGFGLTTTVGKTLVMLCI